MVIERDMVAAGGDPFASFAGKMAEAGLPTVAVEAFRFQYEALRSGATGLVPESDIEPLDSVQSFAELRGVADPAAVRAAMDRTVVLKLNGGLGTSMGMDRAKSLLPVKDGRSFLDVLALQILAARRRWQCRLPLVCMHSFRTRDDSLAVLARHGNLAADLPPDFLQHKVPKIDAATMQPVAWPADPELEWCPPGHGDLYPAMVTSGMLEALVTHGYEYLFVSNSDNLGAVLDPDILAWFAVERIPFLMEVAARTESMRKGGHLARLRADRDRLVLREAAQVPDADVDSFQDISRHGFFNTNNLWLHVPALAEALRVGGGSLALPLIRNTKTVDPADASSPRVYQLETAMGAAIEVFPGARALLVDTDRFAPVKTTNDLLAVRSDATVLDDDWRIVPNPARGERPLLVDLDPQHYKLVADFEKRFPKGPPSLVDCDRLTVHGDVTFGADIVVHGSVTIDAATVGNELADGEVLAS